MSVNEILIVAFGFFLGYWVIAKLIGAKKPAREQPKTENKDTYAPREAAELRPWHEVLAVQSGASVSEIKAAYKSLMSQYHPDKVASLGPELRELAEHKTKEITGAYRQAMQTRGLDA